MLFPKFFQPAVRLTNRLKYPQKFLLISLLFAVPLGLSMALLGQELQTRRDVSVKEQVGLEYLRSLQPMGRSVPQFYAQVLSETANQRLDPAVREQEAQVFRDLQQLADVDRRLGSQLQTSPKLEQVQASWQRIADRQAAWSPQTKVAEFQTLLKQIEALRSTVGDQSNLILDPELDTYYLMDATLLKIPMMQRNLVEIQLLCQRVMRQKNMLPADRGYLLALNGVLKDQNAALRTSMAVAFERDPTHSLPSRLAPALEKFANATQGVVVEIEGLAYDNKIPEPQKYYDLAQQSRIEGIPFWDQTADALHELLNQRIQDLTHRQMVIMSATLLGLAIVAYIFVGFYRSVMQTVAALSAASRQMVDGTQTEPVVLESQDELAQVVASFNQLARALVSSHGQVVNLNQQLKHENFRMSTELDVTRRLQEMMLPRLEELQTISELDISGFMKPASEVGGDYYDVLHHAGRVKIGIGDVTGHGLESGMLMVMVQTAVRTLLESHETNPVRFLDILNRVIYGNIQRMQSDKNLSLALVDYQDGVLSLSGQHEEMIVVRSTGDIERVDTIDLGFPIGLEENITDFIASARIPLAIGDGVVLYTDGITEAENKAGQQYGIDQLCQIVAQNWHRSAEDVRRTVVDDLQQFIGDHTVYDDITLLICKKR